jgi:hypothetical protein
MLPFLLACFLIGADEPARPRPPVVRRAGPSPEYLAAIRKTAEKRKRRREAEEARLEVRAEARREAIRQMIIEQERQENASRRAKERRGIDDQKFPP